MQTPVSRFRFLLCAVLLAAVLPATRAAQVLPQRDLRVELRQVMEGREDGANHYGAGGEDNQVWQPQTVLVRNGGRALLRLNDALPMQWTQSVSTQNTAGSGGNGNGSVNGSGNSATPASVGNALVWFDAGQSLSVQPTWPGGNKPAVLVLEVQVAALGAAQTSANLPKQSRNTLSTTVTVPLAEWLTVAATGQAAKAGVYSSEAGLQGRRLLQVRVTAP